MKRKLLVLLLVLGCVFMIGSTVFASGFVKSVEQKPAPEVVDVDGEIILPDGTRLKIPKAAIIVTPYSLRENPEVDPAHTQVKQMIKRLLEAAFVQISGNSGDLTQLASDVRDEFERQRSASQDPEIRECQPSDLVVTDLYDVSVDTEELNEEQRAAFLDANVRFQINLTVSHNVGANDIFIVAHNFATSDGQPTEDWEVLNKDRDVTISASTVGMVLRSLSCVAFVTAERTSVKPVDPSDNSGKNSPQTSESNVPLYLVGALLLAAAGFVCIKAYGKNRG